MSMKTLDISEARKRFNHLDEFLRGAEGDSEKPVIRITRHGKEAFAVVDFEFLQTILETIEIMSDPESFQAFRDSLEDISMGRLHDHEDVRKEMW